MAKLAECSWITQADNSDNGPNRDHKTALSGAGREQ